MTKTPPELVKMIISIDINTSRNAHRTGEYGYNNDCLLELQKAFPNGEVYESNV